MVHNLVAEERSDKPWLTFLDAESFLCYCFLFFFINKVLIRLIENFQSALDRSLFTETAMMDLSEVFDCIPYDLPIVILRDYGLILNKKVFLNIPLKDKKHHFEAK